MTSRSCLTNLVYDKMTHMVDDGKAVAGILVNCLMLFPTFSWRNCLPVAWTGVQLAGEELAGQTGSKSHSEWSST